MDHKHFQLATRPSSVIFNSKPTNQAIKYKHEGQVSAIKSCWSKRLIFKNSTKTSQRSYSNNNTKMSMKSIDQTH